MNGGLRDKIIADAKDVPSLLASTKDNDPAFYAALTGAHIKNVWIPPIASAVGWAAARYGLGWDAGTCTAVAGGIVVIGTAIFHYLAPCVSPPPPPPAL